MFKNILQITVLISVTAYYSLFLIEAAPTNGDSTEYLQHKSNCNKICSHTKAEAHFDKKSLTCKCILVTKIDGADMALFEKNAKLLALDKEPKSHESNLRKKRAISKNHQNKLLYSDTESSEQLNDIVGQSPPGNPHTISRNDAVKHLDKIRHRLRDLASHPHARNAAARADAIRKSLTDLSHRHIVGPTPEQRAQRAKINLERRTRERQRAQRMRNSTGGRAINSRRALLGVAPNDSTTQSPFQNGKNDNAHAIITQPKDLYDD